MPSLIVGLRDEQHGVGKEGKREFVD
jgi:hypothetical protein